MTEVFDTSTPHCIMHGHFFRVQLFPPHLRMSLMNSSSPGSTPSWFGFVLGILAGFATSCLLIGLVVGYSIGGGSFAGGTTRGGGVALNQPTPPTPPTPPEPTPAKDLPPVTDKDHVRGNANAKVTVVEYSDFECPFCKRHAPTMDQIFSTYKNDVNIVFRHFPLGFHQNAHKEAEASECVAELGGNDAFWKFHDYIFEKTTSNGTGFALDQLPVAAKASGVDAKKFQTCLDSGKYVKFVDDQEQEGIAAGVQGTPGNFIINNQTKESKEISGAVPFSTFQSAIDAILGKKS